MGRTPDKDQTSATEEAKPRWRLPLRRLPLRRRTVLLSAGIFFAVLLLGSFFWFRARYRVAEEMVIPVREFSTAEYPEDPAEHSSKYSAYSGRQLRLVRKDETHFDFIFEPLHDHVASVTFRNIDVSLMTPSEPKWTRDDSGLERIALTDRQWNRQQVRFNGNSEHVEVTGGDGYERSNLFSAELAKNCLNAGLWEVQLFAREDGVKKIYYQGWFTFPLGLYWEVFEHNTGISYWKHWYKLEHWSDPEGTPIRLEGLRKVTLEAEAPARCIDDEHLLQAGEQIRKRRTVDAPNLRTWGDFYKDENEAHFAAFIPPGRYSVHHPKRNEFYRMAKFERALLRTVESPGSSKPLRELELVFRSSKTDEPARFLVSGFDLESLPLLDLEHYPNGLYMPMGIGVPPFYQSYEALEKNPPWESPYFSLLLDGENRWLNNHDVGIDGPAMHRDASQPYVLHVYLLSY